MQCLAIMETVVNLNIIGSVQFKATLHCIIYFNTVDSVSEEEGFKIFFL